MRSFFAQKNSQKTPSSANAEDFLKKKKEKKGSQQAGSNPRFLICCPPPYPLLQLSFYDKRALNNVYKRNKNIFFELEKSL